MPRSPDCCLGAPYYKIAIAGTDRVLAVSANRKLVAQPGFSGTSGELWRIDQLTDGTYRIMPKQPLDAKQTSALVAIGASTVALARFDANDVRARWTFKTP